MSVSLSSTQVGRPWLHWPERGVRSILNFASEPLDLPDSVAVRKVDLATELQILAFHDQRTRPEPEPLPDPFAEVTS